MRERVAAIDTEIENVARVQLSQVKGCGVVPAQLAKAVVASRVSCSWFTDRPSYFLGEAGLEAGDVDRLRRARLALGQRLQYLDAVLPSASDLPVGAVLAQLHADVLRADEHSARASSDPAFTPRITSLEAIELAERAGDALDTLIDATRHFDTHPWLRSFAFTEASHQYASLTPALEALTNDAIVILEEYKTYVQRPVSVPGAALGSPDFLGIVAKLAVGQGAFGLFAFGEKKLKPVADEVQVLGRKPQSADEWSHVRAYKRLLTSSGLRDWAMLHLAFSAGLRVSELISVRVDGLDGRPSEHHVGHRRARAPLLVTVLARRSTTASNQRTRGSLCGTS